MRWVLVFASINGWSADLSRIEKLDWGPIEATWLDDSRFPTFDIVIYFSDGSLSDPPSKSGASSLMFQELFSGTNRYNQKELSDHLEFYGAGYGAQLTHEYSYFAISGLVKDLVPIMKQICHVFSDATFPASELKRKKRQMISSLQNLTTNHSQLADRVFREVTLKNSAYWRPTGGKVTSIRNIKRSDLIDKKSYFNQKVKKRIYLTGPREILKAKNIVLNDCGWGKTRSQFERRVATKKKFEQAVPKFYLVPVKKANQAQIRIGRFLDKLEDFNPDTLLLASSLMGGGFTSILNREVRVLRGLSYGIHAMASMQKFYGRSIIATSTKNESVNELLNVVKSTVQGVINKTPVNEFIKTVSFLSGNFLFQFEKNDSFLRNLLIYDHLNRDLSQLINFPKRIKKYKVDGVSLEVSKLYNWNLQTIVVVGDKSLKKSLQKIAPVKVLKYGRFL